MSHDPYRLAVDVWDGLADALDDEPDEPTPEVDVLADGTRRQLPDLLNMLCDHGLVRRGVWMPDPGSLPAVIGLQMTAAYMVEVGAIIGQPYRPTRCLHIPEPGSHGHILTPRYAALWLPDQVMCLDCLAGRIPDPLPACGACGGPSDWWGFCGFYPLLVFRVCDGCKTAGGAP